MAFASTASLLGRVTSVRPRAPIEVLAREMAGRLLRCAALLSAGGVLAGCTAFTPYPNQWSRPKAERIGECPLIAGRYRNAATEVTTIVYPLTRSGGLGGGPGWSGTHLLALSLDASLRDSGPWVEVEQPDDRTLVIKTPVWSNETEQEVKRVLSRSKGEFACAEGTLSVSMRTKSAAEAAGLSEGWTALGLLLGSAEIHAERHLFTRAENGDLMMEVQETRTGVERFVIPHGDANSFYMRWTPYRPFDAVPRGAR